ncbi:MAG: alpha/beta fold hydrolase [Candidatus Saccharibacteria bacterium]|nr:alpha/beta fold hydrolase [Moraxellaceae bacterium]
MSKRSIHWRANLPDTTSGPRIALIHGLAAGKHMERHLLTFLRAAGYADTSLYSNHLSPARVADDLAHAAKEGRPIVLVGYSQGGSQVLKVAKQLYKRGIEIDLVVSLAAGGLGRFYFPQWGFNMRRIPAGIKRYLNYYAAKDLLGTDLLPVLNLARADSRDTYLENIGYPQSAGVDHFKIVTCYPTARVLPEVQTLFLDRLLKELELLT